VPTPTSSHPAVAPVIEALRTLAAYEPTSAIDLADVLANLHGHGFDNVIDALADVFDHLGEWSGAAVENGAAFTGDVAEQLYQASAALTGYVGSDHVDRARANTGHFLGSLRR
jgi:ABC-type transporter Mla subunit MlaD